MRYKNRIHYLCRSDSGLLKYPMELPKDYNTLGSFYIIGDSATSLASQYEILAVEGDRTVYFEISKMDNKRNFFTVNHPRLGIFIFHLEYISTYGWQVKSQLIPSNLDIIALARLRAWNHDKFEKCCKENDFYFIGDAGLEQS